MREGELKPVHRKFAELIVQGKEAQTAYSLCFPRASKGTARAQGSKLQLKPEMVEYIARLRVELTEQVQSELVLTLQEALEFLTEVVRTPAGLVKQDHRLCQGTKHTPRTLEVKMPCKLRALELAMKLQRLLSTQVEHEAGDTLQDFLVELRAGGAAAREE